MEVILADSARIFYEIVGNDNKETLIFLHGNMEDSSSFHDQIEYFKDNYKVVVIDTRGHGQSSWGSEKKYTLELLADDLIVVLEKLDLDKYFLVGFSDGANIAMEFASRKPSGLLGLVLVGGNLRPWGMKFLPFIGIVGEYFTSFFSNKGRETRKILGLMLFEPKIREGRLSGITVPSMVVAGSEDMIRKRETVRISRLIKGSKLVICKDCDHFFIYNKAGIFNKMLEDWIYSV